jgi:hypothetical protein
MSLPADDVYEVEKRIGRGVALLDEAKQDWRDAIHLRMLDVQLRTQCVLGQVFGHYNRGLNELGLGHDREGAPFGFYAKDLFDDDEWKALQDGWKRELQK